MGQCGQSLIETIVMVPLCIVCAAGLVEAGSLVRSQMQVVEAAGRAGAVSAGAGTSDEVREAATRALPKHLRRSAKVDVGRSEISVTAQPELALLGAAADLKLGATVAVEATGGQT